MTAALVGYDPATADGVFTFGGTGTLLYGAKIGLEKAVPGVRRAADCGRRPVLVCSDRAHYACLTVANWLGLGEDNVVRSRTTDDNQMQLDALRAALREIVAQRPRASPASSRRWARRMRSAWTIWPASCASATSWCEELCARLRAARPRRRGDRLGLERVQRLRLRAEPARLPPPHRARAGRHDAADPASGARRFARHRLPQDRLRAVHLERRAAARRPRLRPPARAATRTRPYIFQSGTRHPGRYTLETTRAGSGPLAALANLRLFGRRGLQALLGHLVTMAEVLREHLEGHAATTVLNGDNFGPVTLFRVYPDGVDTFSMPQQERTDPAMPRRRCSQHNDYNRRIFELHPGRRAAGARRRRSR